MRQLLLAAVALLALLALPAVQAGNTTSAEGGNVTELNISVVQLTQNWQGFFGTLFIGTGGAVLLNATGGSVNQSNLSASSACASPSISGFILLSNSSAQPAGLTPGNLTQLNEVVGNGADNATNTFAGNTSFALSTGTVAGVPSTFLFVNQAPQSSTFREGYFNQGNDLVFAAVISPSSTGYNGSLFDFQILVPAPNLTTIPYFVFTDITATCPGGAVGGGGGAARRFRPALITRPKALQPSKELPKEVPVVEFQEILRKLSLRTNPAQGDILTPATITGSFVNNNALDIPRLHLELLLPRVLFAPAKAHPYPMLFWSARIGALGDHGPAKARAFQWAAGEIPAFDAAASAATPFSFTLIPPLMPPKQLELGAYVLAGDLRIAAAPFQFTVTVPKFAVVAERVQKDVIAVYYLVDNRGKEGKSINIELALNRGRSTLAAEMLGPLRVPANEVIIFGHEYRLNDAVQSAPMPVIDARLRSADEELRAQAVVR